MPLQTPIEDAKTVVFRGTLNSDTRVVYTCPANRVSEITSIRLIKQSDSARLIRAKINIQAEYCPILPDAFVMDEAYVVELIDEGNEIGLNPTDTLELGSDVSGLVYAIVIAMERIK
jgi:hypothetical protein